MLNPNDRFPASTDARNQSASLTVYNFGLQSAAGVHANLTQTALPDGLEFETDVNSRASMSAVIPNLERGNIYSLFSAVK